MLVGKPVWESLCAYGWTRQGLSREEYALLYRRLLLPIFAQMLSGAESL
jgi:hypothetical protein